MAQKPRVRIKAVAVRVGDRSNSPLNEAAQPKAKKAPNIKIKPVKEKAKTVTQKKKEALKWYKGIVGSNTPTASNIEIYREDHLKWKKAKLSPGVMLHFTYLAKHRKTLPHWDAFPLALVMDLKDNNSFLSINLHYVPYYVRERFLKILSQNMLDPDKTGFQKTKFAYSMMKASAKYDFMRPCIKRHLWSQIKSKPVMIPPQDWDKIPYLPSADWIGASEAKVWKASAAEVAKYGKKKK